jgi:hypothetical protein
MRINKFFNILFILLLLNINIRNTYAIYYKEIVDPGGQIWAPEGWFKLKQKYGVRYDLDNIINKWKKLYYLQNEKELDFDKIAGHYSNGLISLKQQIDKIKKLGY